MENSFYEIRSEDTVVTGRDLSLQSQEGMPPDLLKNTLSAFNTDEFTATEEPKETGLTCTWVEPEADNGYSYINAGTCPDCRAGMVRQGNCFSCPSCGWGCCG